MDQKIESMRVRPGIKKKLNKAAERAKAARIPYIVGEGIPISILPVQTPTGGPATPASITELDSDDKGKIIRVLLIDQKMPVRKRARNAGIRFTGTGTISEEELRARMAIAEEMTKGHPLAQRPIVWGDNNTAFLVTARPDRRRSR